MLGFNGGWFYMSLDPLMNWISGRTAMLKRALKAEEKKFLLQKWAMHYTEEFFYRKIAN
jgi:hypothetical protein